MRNESRILILFLLLAPCAQSFPSPITTESIEHLQILGEPVLLVVPGKFDRSGMEQYLVASGIPGQLVGKTSIVFFDGERYHHALTLPTASGEFLKEKSIRLFENRYVNLGQRYQMYYVQDFADTGLEQIFMLQEGDGGVLSVYGFGGRQIEKLLAVSIDDTYAYPIQTLQPGVLKIFPWDNVVERISQTRTRRRFLIYTWDPSSWSYRQTGEGTQLAVWDQKTRLVYPIDEE